MAKLTILSILVVALAVAAAGFSGLVYTQTQTSSAGLEYWTAFRSLAGTWSGNSHGTPTNISAAQDGVCGCQEHKQLEPGLGVGVCQLKGTVDDCCCDYADVEKLNRDVLHPTLSELVGTPYFRYFKVNLWCDCPFWPDDSMCALPACSVLECDPKEVPAPFLADECDPNAAAASQSTVDRTVDPGVKSKLQNISGWQGLNNPWMPEQDADIEFSYVNLLLNPERYTGYKGEHANRIWKTIYSQSCFKDMDNACTEQKIFYRLISGMHSSITAHIAQKYLLDEGNDVWGPNLELFRQRLGHHDVRERVENLYFAYLFVLRAVMKAGPYLESIRYHTGMAQEDLRTMELIHELVNNKALKKSCPVPFDEGRLWKEDDGQLKEQLQTHFHNITKVMDCVGCEKCKLWGKLQMLGIATSLKILFSSEDCSDPTAGAAQLALERNEVIALVNLLERLATSIEVVRTMSQQLGEGAVSSLGAIQEVTHKRLADVL